MVYLFVVDLQLVRNLKTGHARIQGFDSIYQSTSVISV